MKNSIYILLIIFLTSLFICCEDNNNNTDIENLIEKAENLEERLERDPDNLSLRASVSKAYQRVGDHFKFLDENIENINIENLNRKDYIKQLEESLNYSLQYYLKAKSILEENQYEYKLVEIDRKRKIVITHKDPKVVEVFNKIKENTKPNGELDESKFSREELELKKEWDQRINKIIHYKIGLTYRSLVSIYIAYKNIAESNNEQEDVKKWHEQAIKTSLQAEKHYKITIEVDFNYIKAHIALAKLYMYMYDIFQKFERDIEPLRLAAVTIDNAIVSITGARDNPELLFVKASINYHLGDHYKSVADYNQTFDNTNVAKSNYVAALHRYKEALRIYEEELLRVIDSESDDFKKVEKNINLVRDKISLLEEN